MTWVGADNLSAAVLLGAGFGAALWLLGVAVYPPRVNLVAATRRWEHRPRRHPGPGETTAGGVGGWLGPRLSRAATTRGWLSPALRANLALLDRGLETHLVTKTGWAAGGFLLPTLGAAALAAGGWTLPWVPTVLVAAVLATIGFWMPDLDVAERAAARRSDLRRALACYLDLVSMSLAGGRGVPEALPTAAAVGTGWSFELLGRTVATARSTGVTPWVALGELGERTGLPELQDLGSALTLVAHDGAKVRDSLSARASTQRRRQLAEAEGDAKKANQGMSMAQIVLAIGFLLFLGYPAVVNVLAL